MIAFSNEELGRLPKVEPGCGVHCRHCDKMHVIEDHGVVGTVQCDGSQRLAAVSGRLLEGYEVVDGQESI